MPSCRRTRVSVVVVVFVAVAWTGAGASTWQYSEDFLSGQRRDPDLTTAWWDTLSGELKLFPQPLAAVDSFNSTGTAFASAVVGDHLLVADGASELLLSLDVSDPTAIVLDDALDAGAMVRDVAVQGAWAYLALGSGLSLLTADVTDASAPVYGAATGLDGFASGVAVAGNWAYVAQSNAGVATVDIGDPMAPALVDTVHTRQWARDLVVSGGLLFVADSGAGLTILDLAVPGAPTFLANLDTPGSCYGVAVAGSRAYLADGTGGLVIADLADPAQPDTLRTLALPGFCQHVTVSGDTAFVSAGAAGMHIVDVGDPLQPVVVGSRITGGFTYHSSRSGAVVWLSDGDAGVRGFVPDAGGLDLERRRAVSLDVDGSGEPILRARIAADVVDTVSFALSADGGATWLPAEPGSDWVTFDPPGADLRWRADLIPAPGLADPLCRQLDITYERQDSFAEIQSVADVPLDHGRLVRVVWSASRFDAPASGHVVTGYSLYRRFDVLAQSPGRAASPGLYPPGDWDFVVTVPADQEATYAVTAPTLADSTAAGVVWTVFFVRTRTSVPGIYFDSPPDSGYSVANLSPGAIPAPGAVARLEQNAPNPFNPVTWIRFTVPTDGAHVRIEVLDIRGRLIVVLADEIMAAGPRRRRWDGRDAAGRAVASGLYTCALECGRWRRTITMTLLR